MTEQHTTVSTVADGVARIEWVPELHDAGLSAAVDVVRREVDAALTAHPRVEALVAPDDELAQRVATWSGLRREGVMRGVTVDGEPVDRIVYARLATDAPDTRPGIYSLDEAREHREAYERRQFDEARTQGGGWGVSDPHRRKAIERERRGATASNPTPLAG